jgi:carboxymethylenebutenolidase
MPETKIKSFDGDAFDAYVAQPPGGHGPGLLVIHEIFGVNADMRAIADRLAAKGFLALCPDLFWRQEPALQLNEDKEGDLDHALRLYKSFDIEAGVRDLLASLAHLRQLPACDGKVGALGYCLGGRLAYLMAARSDVDCAVSYYGVGIDAMLDEMHDIHMPYLFHFAEQDKFMPPSVRQRILASFGRNPAIRVAEYMGMDHGFARKTGPKYNPEAAAKADALTEEFLAAHLMS